MKLEVVPVKRQKIAGWVYGILLVAAAFVLGWFAGVGQTPSPIQVTVSETVQEPAVPAAESQTQVQDQTQPQAETGLIDLNTADQAALETLPGIGPTLAARILAYRETIGRFVAKEQIMDVEGIGEKRYADLEQLITVEVTHENSGGG